MPDHEQAERIRENVAHIARGCRSGVSHNPAVYEQAIDADLDALAAQLAQAQERIEQGEKLRHRERWAYSDELKIVKAQLAERERALSLIADEHVFHTIEDLRHIARDALAATHSDSEERGSLQRGLISGREMEVHRFQGDPWGPCVRCQHPQAHEIHLVRDSEESHGEPRP